MAKPKKKIVFKIRHNDTIKNSGGEQDDSKGDARIKKCWNTCSHYFNSMPRDLIQDFFQKKMKIVGAPTSAGVAIDIMKARFNKVETAEFFFHELAHFLDEVGFKISSPKNGDHNEDESYGPDEKRGGENSSSSSQGSDENDQSETEDSETGGGNPESNGENDSRDSENQRDETDEAEEEGGQEPRPSEGNEKQDQENGGSQESKESSNRPGMMSESSNEEAEEMSSVSYIQPKNYDLVLCLAKARKNILLVGPAGCGKTVLCEQLALTLQSRRFASVSCSEGMGESEFKGWLLPGEGGRFEYFSSDFVDCYENGGVFCADEIDAADANVLVYLNKAIGNKFFHLPQRKDKTLVKKHKDFIFIACANTFGEGSDFVYVGRNQLDEATLDRFRCGIIPMDYDSEIEEKIVDPIVLEWGRILRLAFAQLQMKNKFVSTRLLLDFSDMKKSDQWGIYDFYNRYLVNWSSDDRKRLLEVIKVNLKSSLDDVARNFSSQVKKDLFKDAKEEMKKWNTEGDKAKRNNEFDS